MCMSRITCVCVCARARALELQAEIMRSSVNLLFIFGLNLQNIHGNLFIQIKQRFDHLVVIRGIFSLVFFLSFAHSTLFWEKIQCFVLSQKIQITNIMPFLSDMQMSNFNGHSCFGKKQQQQQGRTANACAYKLLQHNERIFQKWLSSSYARKKEQKRNSNIFVERFNWSSNFKKDVKITECRFQSIEFLTVYNKFWGWKNETK